jgi:hypothetical protein
VSKLINVKAVKELAKARGRRVGQEFIAVLNDFVRHKTELACDQFNGGKLTLDATVAGFVGIRIGGGKQ